VLPFLFERKELKLLASRRSPRYEWNQHHK